MAETKHRTVQTNGIRMHCVEHGTGPLVVLCHGFPESWYSWRHQLQEIEAGLEALSELREKPAGTIRITATDYAADTILWPKLTKLLRQYPDIKVEIIIDYGLTDIVGERFDAGVRSGKQVAKDMIAVRIGPDMRSAVIGAPSYFKGRPEPQRPQELIGHNCINLRLPTHGGLYAWEFEKDGRELRVHVEGQLVFNGTFQMLNAALAGFGLAYVPEDVAQPHLVKGSSEAGARGLVPCVFRLSPLLPEPPPWLARARQNARSAPSPPALRR